MSDPMDLRIPDAIMRRLEGADQAIGQRDHVRTSRPPSLLVVPGRVGVRKARRTVSTPRFRPSRGMAAIVLVMVLATAGAVAVLEPLSLLRATLSQPGASAGGETGAPASATVSDGASLVPSIAPTSQPPVRAVRTAGSAVPIVQKELRAPCLGKATEPGTLPKKAFVLSAARRASGPGWLDAAQTVWYGPSPLDAAAAFGARSMVIGDDGNWVILGDSKSSEAWSLVGLQVGSGTAYWLGTRLVPAACR